MTSHPNPVSPTTGAPFPTAAAPTAPAPTARHGSRLRRLGGTLVATGALAFGGVAVLPTGLAEAAGVHDGRIQHVATQPEAPTTTTSPRPVLDPTRRNTLRVRIGPDGEVEVV